MPDNSRPRYVTPPFNPVQDPMGELERLLGSPSNVQAPQSPGALESILSALASGVGTFASNNPGEALLGQINQISQRREREKLMYQQEQMRRDAMRDQLALTTILDNLNEQRQVRAEGRAALRDQEKTLEERAFLVEQANRQYANQEKLAKISYDNQEKLAGIELEGRKELLKLNQDYETKIMDLKETSKQIADSIELQTSYQLMGMDAASARSIASKRIKDEKLTPKEEAALNKAFRQARADKLRSSRSGGGGSSFSSEKNMMKIFTDTIADIRRNPMIELSNGTIVEANAIKTDAAGDPILGSDAQGNPITIRRYLNADEAVEILGPKIMKATIGAMSGGSKPVEIVGSPEANAAATLDAAIKTAKAQGYTDQEVIQYMMNRREAYGDTAIKNALIRSGLVNQSKTNVKKQEKLNKSVPNRGQAGNWNRPF